MRVRVLAGALLAVPALLVATATNGHAGVERGTVAFAGRITVVPGGSGSASVCFRPLDMQCLDGVAAGAVLAGPVVGMAGSIGYDEACTAVAPYTPAGTATLSLDLDVLGSGSQAVSARWIRAGLVAVIIGPEDSPTGAAGAAVVVPAPHVPDVPLCGSPIDYVLTGSMVFE